MDIKGGSQYSLSNQTRNYETSDRNFEYQMQSTESIKNPTKTHVEYTYSDSNMGSYKGIREQWEKIEPSYIGGNYQTNQEIEYKFSNERPKYDNFSLEV